MKCFDRIGLIKKCFICFEALLMLLFKFISRLPYVLLIAFVNINNNNNIIN